MEELLRRRGQEGIWPTGCGTILQAALRAVREPAVRVAHLGRAADGFSALVNYHRLDRKTLEKLTYTYLGRTGWRRQRADARDGVPVPRPGWRRRWSCSEARADPRGRAAVRHLRAVEGASRAADRVGSRISTTGSGSTSARS